MSKISDQYAVFSYRTASLSRDEYICLVQMIWDLYIWFAPDSSMTDVYNRLHRNPETYVDVVVDTISGSCVGFSAYHTECFEGKHLMFRGGTVVSDRSKGLYKGLLEHAVQVFAPDFLVAMTQNQRVYESLRSFSSCSCAYPSLDKEVPLDIQRIAQYFCPVQDFNPESMIVQGVYNSIRKEKSFKTGRDSRVSKMFNTLLGENDGFMVVVPV
jgi:hypothetical protein